MTLNGSFSVLATKAPTREIFPQYIENFIVILFILQMSYLSLILQIYY